MEMKDICEDIAAALTSQQSLGMCAFACVKLSHKVKVHISRLMSLVND